MKVDGLIPGEIVEIISVERAGSAQVQLIYRGDCGFGEMLVGEDRASRLTMVTGQRPFDADGALFRSVAEACRIELAHLFDSRLAVHASLIEPLPHQIRAVYEDMLPRQPLRFLLADDPGAGKTIMAGLYMKELILRGDARRCLVVAPGSLVAQWQQELDEKFALGFDLFTKELIRPVGQGRHPLLIARLDQLARNSELQEAVMAEDWDVVVVDEAHRMSAHSYGKKVDETLRYKLGRRLGERCRHLLLLTATPHTGKPEDFCLFMRLLDGDRFADGETVQEQRRRRQAWIDDPAHTQAAFMAVGPSWVDAPHIASVLDGCAVTWDNDHGPDIQTDVSDAVHWMVALVRVQMIHLDRPLNRILAVQHDSVPTNDYPDNDDVSDMMRRVIKEDMLRFDGRRLFPERHAKTVPYKLTKEEMNLYEAVTNYVSTQMGRAEQLRKMEQGVRANRVAFGATIMQRRLASSPEAIYQTLHRRRCRLDEQLRKTRSVLETGANQDNIELASVAEHVELDDDLDELDAETQEDVVDYIAETAFKGAAADELVREIETLRHIEQLANSVRSSDTDRKWLQLRELLSAPEIRGEDSRSGRIQHRIVVFTENKDTLTYLAGKLRDHLGRDTAVVEIHGGVRHEDRMAAQKRFTSDPECLVLVATDAAGEGINLQESHLVINYDLPWNPNRLEQRFGRVHRIGQNEVCHMWSLVADETREGAVYMRLLEKLNEIRDALGREQVFDVLGEALPERELRDLLMQAIQYGDDPRTQARLVEVVDGRVGDGLTELIERDALATEGNAALWLESDRDRMLEADAHRLQPTYVRHWFLDAFRRIDGRWDGDPGGRFRITRVPPPLRQRSQAHGPSLPSRYECVTFDAHHARANGESPSEWLVPGHPLIDAMSDLTIEQHGDLLKRGTVLFDPTDCGHQPRLLLFIDHSVTDACTMADGTRRVVSRRFEFVSIEKEGTPKRAGPAPYIDYRPLTTDEKAAVEPSLMQLGWPGADTEKAATDYYIDEVAVEHLEQVKRRTLDRVDKTKRAVDERLTAEASRLHHRARKEKERIDSGASPNPNPSLQHDRLRDQAEEMEGRRNARLTELDREAQLSSSPPVIAGVALIVPAGMVAAALGQHGSGQVDQVDGRARSMDGRTVERLAVKAVLQTEQRLGRHAQEMPSGAPGFDIRSTDDDGNVLFIQVKGNIAGTDSFIVTQNELRVASNVPRVHVLAMVEISPPEKDAAMEAVERCSKRIRYLRQPFDSDLDLPFDTESTTLEWSTYFNRGSSPDSTRN